MSTHRMSTHRVSFCTTLAIGAAACVATAQPADRAKTEQAPAEFAAYAGVLTGNDVYVRSGPSENYYPVAKLQAGQRVRVLGAEGEWLAVLPPEGCFSMIAASYVDLGQASLGVVNGDNVRVRAGSSLNDKKYAVQTQLSRGAEVRILGKTDDDFYRIQPPDGVKLWIAAEFVNRAGEGGLRSETAGEDVDALLVDDATGPAEGADVPAAKATSVPSSASTGITGAEDATTIAKSPSVKDAEPSKVKALATTPAETETASNARIQALRDSLKPIDDDMNAELQKPLLQRDLQRIVDRFAPIAEQQDDEYSRMYAETRVRQLEQMIEMNDAVKNVRMVGEQVTSDRQAALVARNNIRPMAPLIHEGFDIEGELRLSAVFTASTQPKRYRLIDHKSATTRTVGYVEVPSDSQIVIDDLLGRIVGVRAREIRYETGDVNPIAIYIAAEIVAINPGDNLSPDDDGSHGTSIDLIAGSDPLLVETH